MGGKRPAEDIFVGLRMSQVMTDSGAIRMVMSSQAANTAPTLGSASAAPLRYLRWMCSFHFREASPVVTDPLPMLVAPQDAAGSRESIMSETAGSDRRFFALRVRVELAT